MSEKEDTQRDSQPQPEPEPQIVASAQPQVEKPPTVPAGPNSSVSRQVGGGWARASTSQVVRTVAAALLTTAVVGGALFLLWQGRPFFGLVVLARFLGGVPHPP